MNELVSLFENSKKCILFSTLSGDIHYVNPAMLSMLGYSNSEVVGQKAWFFDHESDKAQTQKIYSDFEKESNVAVEVEKSYIHADGSFIPVSDSMSVVVTSENRPLHIMVLCTHKNDKKTSDPANVKINEVVRSTSAFIVVINCEGTVEYANKVPEWMSMKDLLGSNIYDCLPINLIKIIKKHTDVILKDQEAVFFESEYITPQGEKYYYYNNMSPIFRDGKLISISFVSNDVTELKTLEKNSTRNQDLINLSLQAAEIGVWEWDTDSEILTWDDNLYKILGADKTKIKASFEVLLQLIYEEDQDKILKETLLAYEIRSKFESDFRIRRLDTNEVRWISFKSKFTLDDDGEIVKLLGIAWDNTDIKKLDFERQRITELERQNTELQQFAYLASHDLKSPLRTINNFSGLLIKRYSKQLDETANTFLNHIHSSVNRMDRQIRDLLNFAMIGHNNGFRTLNCQDIVTRVIEDLDYAIQVASCKLYIAELPKEIYGIRTELLFLFENLISNAIKFRRKDVQLIIKISYQEFDNHFQFCVEDNGIGINEKYKDKIFILFQRLHFWEEFEGTGIGLAHCKKAVELHGGNIWVESAINEGSCFYFTIQKQLP